MDIYDNLKTLNHGVPIRRGARASHFERRIGSNGANGNVGPAALMIVPDLRVCGDARLTPGLQLRFDGRSTAYQRSLRSP